MDLAEATNQENYVSSSGHGRRGHGPRPVGSHVKVPERLKQGQGWDALPVSVGRRHTPLPAGREWTWGWEAPGDGRRPGLCPGRRDWARALAAVLPAAPPRPGFFKRPGSGAAPCSPRFPGTSQHRPGGLHVGLRQPSFRVVFQPLHGAACTLGAPSGPADLMGENM